MQFLLLLLALFRLASKTLGANFDVASSTALTTSTGARIIGASASGSAGTSVAPAGDINQDGIDDLIIGVPLESPSGRNSAGVAYIVYGKKGASMLEIDLATLDKTTGIKIIGAALGDKFGQSVSAAGDINQDGVDDVIIGAPYFDSSTGTDSGAAYVIYGKKGGMSDLQIDAANLDQTTGIRIIGAAPNDQLGYSVAAAGDINQDGVDDVIIGAPYFDWVTLTNAGASYIIYGKKNGMSTLEIGLTNLDTSIGIRIIGTAATNQLGSSVAAAGDFNKDGVNDVMIGSPYSSSSGRGGAGATYIIYGKKNGMSTVEIDLANSDTSVGMKIIGANSGDQLGYSVAVVGDFNQDGGIDIIVGSNQYSPPSRSSAGAAYIVYGWKGSYGCDQWTSPSTCQVCSAGNVLDATDGQCHDSNLPQNTNTESTSTNTPLIIGVTLGSVGVVVLAGLFYYFLKRRALSVRRIRIPPQSPTFKANSPVSADPESSPVK